MAVSYQRKGKTSKDWYSSGEGYFIGHQSKITIFFDLGASGGTSEVKTNIDTESFGDLAIAMIQADREAAIKAFGAALQYQPIKRRKLI